MKTSVMLSGNGDLSSTLIASISQKVEERGFYALWFGETTLRDAGVLAGIAAFVTKKLALGTSIINVFTRTPGQLAMLGATLSELSGGRFTLGLGVSTPSIVQGWHGVNYERPLKRMEETLKLLKKYFSFERFNYQGEFFSPTNARLKLRSSPRIAVAALNPKMIRLASQHADQVILNLYPVEKVKYVLPLTKSAESSVMLYCVIASDEKALDAAKELLAFYGSSQAYARLFASFGFSEEAKAMLNAWERKDREGAKRAVTQKMVEDLMVLGDIKLLRDRVKQYHEVGISEVLIAPSPFGDFLENIKAVVENY